MPPTPHCCVACDRPAVTGQTACPYCGEAVYEPRGHRIARIAALALLMIGTPLFVWTRGCPMEQLGPAPHTACDGVLLALGLGLLLTPSRLTGVAPATRTARLWQVVRPLGGAWLLAGTATLVVLALRHGTHWSPASIALASILPVALGTLPGLACLPWRGLVAGAVIAAGWQGISFCLA